MRAAGGKTPSPTPSATPMQSNSPTAHRRRMPETLDDMQSIAGTPNRTDVRLQCLKRDRHHCVVSHFMDMKTYEQKLDENPSDRVLNIDGSPAKYDDLEAAHIIPHCLMSQGSTGEVVCIYSHI